MNPHDTNLVSERRKVRACSMSWGLDAVMQRRDALKVLSCGSGWSGPIPSHFGMTSTQPRPWCTTWWW
jgi:hypothetical protein